VLSVGWKAPLQSNAPSTNFSKIYLTDTHLLVGEYFKGVNIFDITTPTAIHSVGYIHVQGNNDVAITGNILYADSYEHLLVFDFSNPANPTIIDTLKNVFRTYTHEVAPVVQPVYDNTYGGASGCAPSCSQTSSYNTNPVLDGGRSESNGGGTSGMGQVGQGGSMARFVIHGPYLYCIDVTDLIVFDIRDAKNPSLVGKVNIGFGIETLFQHDDYLFIGSQTGMFIFDARDIKVPVKVSEFRHARSCDPVFVEGNRAYITLRSGGRCGPTDNALHIVDIKDVLNPVLITSYLMTNPAGLSVANGIAYICDNRFIRIVDVRDEGSVHELSSIELGNSYDVIYNDGLLFIVAPNGVFIYNVSDPVHPARVAVVSSIG